MILLSAYCAVLLSFASGLLALMMNQRQTLLALSQYCFKKFFIGDVRCQDWINNRLEEQRFPVFLRQVVFILLGLSGVFAVIAGL
ncbi:MAG: hydrogenase 4 subunit B, partial [Methylococcaceae bacterium]